MSGRRGCGVRQEILIPGALSILTGAVPGRARGLAHTAPTYAVGLRDCLLHRPLRPRFLPLLNQTAGRVTDKAALRRRALDRRDALSDIQRATASEAIAVRAGIILTSLEPGTVTFYLPIRSECDTRSLMTMAAAKHSVVGLPAIVDTSRIVFRRYEPGDRVIAGSLGTRAPGDSAPLVTPDTIVLPMVAFDRRGMRLGYGRGHYDRAINALRKSGRQPKLLGIAFSVQEVDPIPAEPHDVRLDWIVTEKETLEFGTTED